MNIATKCIRHFNTITRHRWEVMKACFRCGLYWQGIVHDLSKYSLAEFVPSAKYFQGTSSPIDAEKAEKGYSYAWLHHRGRNPHHWEYWIDNLSKGGEPTIIPYKYCMEMICDWIGAGKVYGKEKWTIEEPHEFFVKKLNNSEIRLHPKMMFFFKVVLEHFGKDGYRALNKDATKIFYDTVVKMKIEEDSDD